MDLFGSSDEDKDLPAPAKLPPPGGIKKASTLWLVIALLYLMRCADAEQSLTSGGRQLLRYLAGEPRHCYTCRSATPAAGQEH